MNPGSLHTAGNSHLASGPMDMSRQTSALPEASAADRAGGDPMSSAASSTGNQQPMGSHPDGTEVRADKLPSEPSAKLAFELKQFEKLATDLRDELELSPEFEDRCQQAFDIANDLFGNAPTWVCFYRELMGGDGMIRRLFSNNDEFGAFLRTEQYHQIQLMLTALRGRDMPENDPNDPQRMITVRLPKSLHQAMCVEARRLNISVNRLCISRMLQLLDPKMIPETTSKPRGRKPRIPDSATPQQ